MMAFIKGLLHIITGSGGKLFNLFLYYGEITIVLHCVLYNVYTVGDKQGDLLKYLPLLESFLLVI